MPISCSVSPIDRNSKKRITYQDTSWEGRKITCKNSMSSFILQLILKKTIAGKYLSNTHNYKTQNRFSIALINLKSILKDCTERTWNTLYNKLNTGLIIKWVIKYDAWLLYLSHVFYTEYIHLLYICDYILCNIYTITTKLLDEFWRFFLMLLTIVK